MKREGERKPTGEAATPLGVQRPAALPPPAWDQADATALLADLGRDLARIERERHRGRFPETIARLVADGVSICRDLANRHELEAERGWNALELMRQSAELTLRIARGERAAGRGSV